jgi:hypothetical protein
MCVVFPELLDEEGVRRALGAGVKPICKATLARRLADTPDFPKPFTVGRDRRWFAEEVVAWITAQKRRQYYDPFSKAPEALAKAQAKKPSLQLVSPLKDASR